MKIIEIQLLKKNKGLSECKWPGRNQVIKSKNGQITYYLDGAHTIESIEQFVDWFIQLKRNSSCNERNVLLFNYTGERDASKFLRILMVCFKSQLFKYRILLDF